MGEIIRKQGRRLVAASVIRQRLRLSSAGEFHPHALQEPDMNVTTLFGYLRKPLESCWKKRGLRNPRAQLQQFTRPDTKTRHSKTINSHPNFNLP